MCACGGTLRGRNADRNQHSVRRRKWLDDLHRHRNVWHKLERIGGRRMQGRSGVFGCIVPAPASENRLDALPDLHVLVVQQRLGGLVGLRVAGRFGPHFAPLAARWIAARSVARKANDRLMRGGELRGPWTI